MQNVNVESFFLSNDLSLSESEANEILGGLQQVDPPQPEIPGSGGPEPKVTFRPWGCTCCSFNHNETVEEDNANELSDLTVSNDAEVTGGMLKRIRIGGMS